MVVRISRALIQADPFIRSRSLGEDKIRGKQANSPKNMTKESESEDYGLISSNLRVLERSLVRLPTTNEGENAD
jgi:hypothetical protein